MNLNSFLLEQALKKLKLSEESLSQFRLVSASGDVGGNGFPSELFELSAPMIIRGLLNFSVLQMNREWIYPYWVLQQLDPKSVSFVASSQNPLLINTTHRNWTTIGSPTGFHEAIVDPRGLVTPLPREWSVDALMIEHGESFFPSRSSAVNQQLDPNAPSVVTTFDWHGLRLCSEAFVGTVRGGKDVLFCRSRVQNLSSARRSVQLCIAIRPFGVEGVAPIRNIEFASPRVASIDGITGVVFQREPNSILVGSASLGDTAMSANEGHTGRLERKVSCSKGLANAVSIFEMAIEASAVQSICYSVALGTKEELASGHVKTTWRVSFDSRRQEQVASWVKEAKGSMELVLGDRQLQALFDASRVCRQSQTDRFSLLVRGALSNGL